MFSLLRHSARLATKASAAQTAPFSLTTKALEKNLYLGNLSWSLTPETLRSAIAQHVASSHIEASPSAEGEGSSSVLSAEDIEGHLGDLNIITDRLSGRSRGYGFLKIEDDHIGEQVLAALAECEVEGRQINCREAESRPAFGAGGGGGDRPPRRQYDGGERRGGYSGGGGGYGSRNGREGGDRRGGSGGYGERRGNDRGGRRGDGYGESRDY